MNAVSVQKNGFDVTLNPRFRNQLNLKKLVRAGGEIKVNGVVVSVERVEKHKIVLSRRWSGETITSGTWCSSAKRENFNIFSFSCLYYATQISRISIVSLTRNQGSSAHSIMTNT